MKLNYQLSHTHTRLTALFPALPGWAGTRKVKPIRILLKQETVSGSGISWAVCKSAPHSRQITMPAPHHSIKPKSNITNNHRIHSARLREKKRSMMKAGDRKCDILRGKSTGNCKSPKSTSSSWNARSAAIRAIRGGAGLASEPLQRWGGTELKTTQWRRRWMAFPT